MKNFTGYQWLLIDAANNFGLDKLTFEERIERMEDMLALPNCAEVYAPQAETPALFIKALMAISKARAGQPTGHMVGVDAICSGIQIMSVLTGCVAGARATGLIDPEVRADAYTTVTGNMNAILAENGAAAIVVPRKDAKDATMTSFYGSKKVPEVIFGADSPELDAFYEAANKTAPGAWELLQDLLGSWQPYALGHEWKLPDGFDARVKVMNKKEVRIEVDELDHASFTYEFYENVGTKRGLSNAANVTHSMDAYVLREMHRRCNYDREAMNNAAAYIEMELIKRNIGTKEAGAMNEKCGYYMDQYTRSGLASAAILPHLNTSNVRLLSTAHLEALATIVNTMLEHKPFPLVTVHDEFKAHANNINRVRWHYKEILAEIADSNVLDDILSQLVKMPVNFNRLSFNLGDQIRESNYALC